MKGRNPSYSKLEERLRYLITTTLDLDGLTELFNGSELNQAPESERIIICGQLVSNYRVQFRDFLINNAYPSTFDDAFIKFMFHNVNLCQFDKSIVALICEGAFVRITHFPRLQQNYFKLLDKVIEFFPHLIGRLDLCRLSSFVFKYLLDTRVRNRFIATYYAINFLVKSGLFSDEDQMQLAEFSLCKGFHSTNQLWPEPKKHLNNFLAYDWVAVISQYFRDFYSRKCSRSLLDIINPFQTRFLHNGIIRYPIKSFRPFLEVDDFRLLREIQNCPLHNIRPPPLLDSRRYGEAYRIILDRMQESDETLDCLVKATILQHFMTLDQESSTLNYFDQIPQINRSYLESQYYCGPANYQLITRYFFSIPY